MPCKRVKSWGDSLCLKSKRLLVLLFVSSAILTYIVYDRTSRSRSSLEQSYLRSFQSKNKKTKTFSGGGIVKQPKQEHVAIKVSSGFKTTLNPALTSFGGKKFSSESLKETTTDRKYPEKSLQRHEKSSLNEDGFITDDEKKGNNSEFYAKTVHGDRKRLMNFRSHVKDDEADRNVAKIGIEDGEMRKRLPNAIIIGVKKGGTRALLEILKIHPSIRACSSEVHFFDRDENYEQGLEWYRQQMPASLTHQITIEKSPSYFIRPEVPERVYRMSKTVKLLVIVRDPTRRAISDYTQSLERKPDNPPFEEMVMDADGKIDEDWSKLEIGRYAKHLARWLKYFPLHQIHFVSGEELIKRPAKEVQLVERFLKLKPFITEDNFFFNESKGFPCFVGKITENGSVKKSHCMGETKGRKHPDVQEDVLERLREFFRPLNGKFYSMVGRNFNWD